MSFFKGFKQGFHRFGAYITNIINFILLTFVYIVGVGLTSIVAKITGKHFINMNKKGESYWKDLNLSTEDKEKYYRQF